MNKRKVYPLEFRREAVAMAQLPNAVVEEVARNLGIPSGSLHRWIRAEKEKGSLAFPGQGKQLLTAEQAEIQRLRKENERLRMEREILQNRSWSPATTPKDETAAMRVQTGGVGWKSSPMALVLRA